GFMSRVSRWLGPPVSSTRMTERCRPRPASGEEDVARPASREGRPRPSRPLAPTWRNSRRRKVGRFGMAGDRRGEGGRTKVGRVDPPNRSIPHGHVANAARVHLPLEQALAQFFTAPQKSVPWISPSRVPAGTYGGALRPRRGGGQARRREQGPRLPPEKG